MSQPQNPEPARARKPDRIVLWSALLLVILVSVYIAAWFVSASLLRNGVERWIAERRAEGLTVETANPALTGFPTRIAVRLQNVSLTVPPAKGSWRWHTGKVDVVGHLLSLSDVSLDLSGMHEISGGWIPQTQPLHVASERARLGFVVDSGGRVSQSRFTAVGLSLSWSDALLLHTDAVDATVSLIANQGATPAVSSHLVLGVENLSLPPLPAPLTPTLRKLAITADVDGPMSNSGPLPQVLEAWRSAGGAIDVKDFTLDWPPLFVAGNGTAALDQNLQPMGSFTTRINGLDSVIDAVISQKGLDQRVGAMAKGVVGLLSQNGTNGAREVRAPISVQDRMLSIGPLQLLEIPPVKWPSEAVP
jgi:hypothetical protein